LTGVESRDDDPPHVEAHVIRCVSCSRAWDNIRERWHLFQQDAAAVFNRPECLVREFGDA
jgi:hypothetical protein